MSRDEMITAIIHKYGFEAPETIRFFGYLEKYTIPEQEKLLKVAFHWIMMKKVSI